MFFEKNIIKSVEVWKFLKILLELRKFIKSMYKISLFTSLLKISFLFKTKSYKAIMYNLI